MQGSYREWPAPGGLAGVVACVWRNDTSAARVQRVLPDGCMDLIWMNGAVHIAGPDTHAFLATMDAEQVVIGPPVERQRGGHVGHHQPDRIQSRVDTHGWRPYDRAQHSVLNGSDRATPHSRI